MKTNKAKVKTILTAIFVVLSCLMVFAGCAKKNTETESGALSAPTHLRVIDRGEEGYVCWDAVKDAEGYIVTVNGKLDNTTENHWTVTPLNKDYEITVCAYATGKENSESSSVNFAKKQSEVKIVGGSECKEGNKIEFTAEVTNAEDKSVKWEIISGGEYAEITDDGLFTTSTGITTATVTIKATLIEDNEAFATKDVTVIGKPVLTQDMLNKLNTNKIAFNGFIRQEQWKGSLLFGSTLYATGDVAINTALDENNWFCEYNAGNPLKRYDYYFNNGGNAEKVSVDLNNVVVRSPLLDKAGNGLSWADTDYKNGLKNLTLSDFEFDTDAWQWKYNGTPEKMQKIISSCCAAPFVPKNLYVVITDGEVAGLYSETADDRLSYPGYIFRQKLTLSVDTAPTVIPKLSKYVATENTPLLQTAIDNMKALSSFTTECLDAGTTGSTTVYDGYVETVTGDACYFEPFTFTPSQTALIEIGDGNRVFSGSDFGYCTTGGGVNAFSATEEKIQAVQAYPAGFYTRPKFDFAAEIFTSSVINTDGSVTFTADKYMSQVATQLYFGYGNDMALYGIFANGESIRAKAFYPYVTVKDGYIVKAGFSYYMGGAGYGEFAIEYRDFNSAALNEKATGAIAEIRNNPRLIPGWGDITVYKITQQLFQEPIVEEVGSALDNLKEMFGDNIASDFPCITEVFGDTVTEIDKTGFNLNGKYRSVLDIYVAPDVDNDFTIGSSITAFTNYLSANGFTLDANTGLYTKGEITIDFGLSPNSDFELKIRVYNNK